MSANADPKGNERSPEGDWIARQLFSAEELQRTPEEYAARYAHRWGCFSLHQYQYADPVLGAWIRRLAEILFSKEETEHCRLRFLTDEERAAIQQEENEAF
jgi:hypothetical protein